MNRKKTSALVVLGQLALSLPLFAHHGTGVSYDQQKVVTVKGIVKEFDWRNPHSGLYLESRDASGNGVTYAVEMGAPAVLSKMGYTRTLLKPGDEVEIGVHPSFTTPTSGDAISGRIILNG
jgi:hypothetical protein